MTKGEIDFGLVMADTSIQALAGTGPFQGKAVEDLAVLYVHDIVTLQLVVRADSGVATLKELQGKKFSAGIRGSGAELLTRQMFQLLGIEPQWSPGSIQDAIEGTQNRQLAGYSKYGVGAGLRLYAPRSEVLTGKWNPAPVTKSEAFMGLSYEEMVRGQNASVRTTGVAATASTTSA